MRELVGAAWMQEGRPRSQTPGDNRVNMKRRHFVQGAACVLLPAAAAWPHVRILPRLQTPDYVFFDERFPRARGVAAAGSGPTRLVAVHADITALWIDELERVTGQRPLHLHGVTTHSFLFCLRVLAADHAELDCRFARLDQNLLRWTMWTTPRADFGTTRNG